VIAFLMVDLSFSGRCNGISAFDCQCIRYYMINKGQLTDLSVLIIRRSHHGDIDGQACNRSHYLTI
jgi:hypothetical protein